MLYSWTIWNAGIYLGLTAPGLAVVHDLTLLRAVPLDLLYSGVNVLHMYHRTVVQTGTLLRAENIKNHFFHSMGSMNNANHIHVFHVTIFILTVIMKNLLVYDKSCRNFFLKITNSYCQIFF